MGVRRWESRGRLEAGLYIRRRIYIIGGLLRFIWDAAKEARNLSKHGLDFSFAGLLFADPLHVILFDRVEDGQERWHCIGAVAGGLRVLLLVHCHPDPDDPETVRVIGLREATRTERRRYEDGE